MDWSPRTELPFGRSSRSLRVSCETFRCIELHRGVKVKQRRYSTNGGSGSCGGGGRGAGGGSVEGGGLGGSVGGINAVSSRGCGRPSERDIRPGRSRVGPLWLIVPPMVDLPMGNALQASGSALSLSAERHQPLRITHTARLELIGAWPIDACIASAARL